jgi:SAM-dependent methyltransferase
MDQRIRNEVEHGARIAKNAEEVWNWSGPAGARRWARRVELLTDRIPAGAQVLEIGCGTGLFTHELAKRSIRAAAIDISPDLLERAQARCAGHPEILFSAQNAYATDFAAGSFDAVVGMSVLHHLELGQALREFRRLLRPDGLLLFSEPNMLNPVVWAIKNIPWIRRKAGDSPDETAFVRFVLGARIRAAGFEVEALRPFDFLHPSTPARAVPFVERIGGAVERIPLMREIAGSLFVAARRRA